MKKDIIEVWNEATKQEKKEIKVLYSILIIVSLITLIKIIIS